METKTKAGGEKMNGENNESKSYKPFLNMDLGWKITILVWLLIIALVKYIIFG